MRDNTDASLGERTLVARAQAGDGEAFGVLAERYSTRLRRTLFRITRDCDAAWDATQEALMRAWRNIHRFERRASFYTWLTRIGINEAYRSGRRSREDPEDPTIMTNAHAPDWGSLPDEIFESREFLGTVAEALEELNPDYRTAVKMRDIDGLSTAEAAEALGIGERALKSRLRRGRMALRERLDDYFSEGYG